ELHERGGLLRRHAAVLEGRHDFLPVHLYAVEDRLGEGVILLGLVGGGAHVLDLEGLALLGVALAGLTVAGPPLRLPSAFRLLVDFLRERRGAEENRARCNRRQETNVLHWESSELADA